MVMVEMITGFSQRMHHKRQHKNKKNLSIPGPCFGLIRNCDDDRNQINVFAEGASWIS